MFVLRLLTGSTEAVVFLHVKVPPSIAGIQGPRKIGVGQNTSFFCRMKEGDPEPSFTWTKDGDKLVTSKDQRVVVENDKVRLKVVQKQDGGFYSCTADNEVGEGQMFAWRDNESTRVHRFGTVLFKLVQANL